MEKKKVALIFGGQSSEHEVSCWSVVSVLENILSSSENTYDDSEIDSEDLFEND